MTVGKDVGEGSDLEESDEAHSAATKPLHHVTFRKCRLIVWLKHFLSGIHLSSTIVRIRL